MQRERESEREKGGGVERELFPFLTHIGIETAKIVRFLQFKLCCGVVIEIISIFQVSGKKIE